MNVNAIVTDTTLKRFRQACKRNQQPILEQLQHHFKDRRRVLEIGSGTGQHAIFFASKLPHLHWYTSDMPENHTSINAWVMDSNLTNVSPPVEFTVGVDCWPEPTADAVFTANTTHTMQPEEARQMMMMVAENLPKQGVFCQYGPMKINGDYTSESNQEFDQSLKAKGFGGIRDIDELLAWGKGMELTEKIPMPTNNFLLVWRVI